jgi:hypothetical protein
LAQDESHRTFSRTICFRISTLSCVSSWSSSTIRYHLQHRMYWYTRWV